MSLKQDTVVQLLLKHRGKLLGAIRAMVADEHLAEDIFQEISIAALNKHDEITCEDHFGPWMRKAARLQSLTVLRNRNRLPHSLPDEILGSMEPHWRKFDERSDAVMSDALRTCLDHLGPYARQLIKSRYVEGKRGNDLASALKRSMNTVYVALTRVHNTLRECMKQRLAEENKRV